MRGLLIRCPFIDQILDGKKVWEMRGSRTLVREQIALIASASGTVIGVCDLANCIGPLTAEQYRKNARKARTIPSEAKLSYYKQTYAWVMKNPHRLVKPVPYAHPPGAIIWVRLEPAVEKKIRAQLRKQQ